MTKDYWTDELKIDQYHTGPGVSSTQLPTIAYKSPQHWAREFKPSYATALGSLVHLMLLEPHLFTDDSIAEIGSSLRPADKKRLPIALEGIANAAEKCGKLQKYIEVGVRERSFFGVCPNTGVLRKVRPDIYIPGNNVILDVKTTKDASLTGFSTSIANFYYHWSAAYYIDVVSQVIGQQIRQFGWIAIETEPPYGINFIYAPEEALEIARECIAKALRRYANANRETGYSEEWKAALIKPWLFYQDQDIEEIAV